MMQVSILRSLGQRQAKKRISSPYGTSYPEVPEIPLHIINSSETCARSFINVIKVKGVWLAKQPLKCYRFRRPLEDSCGLKIRGLLDM